MRNKREKKEETIPIHDFLNLRLLATTLIKWNCKQIPQEKVNETVVVQLISSSFLQGFVSVLSIFGSSLIQVSRVEMNQLISWGSFFFFFPRNEAWFMHPFLGIELRECTQNRLAHATYIVVGYIVSYRHASRQTSHN